MALGRGAKGTLVKGNPRFSLTAYAEKLISFFFFISRVKVCVCSVVQLCQTLCDPMDFKGSLLSMGILQARIPQWVAMPCSRGSSQLSDPTQAFHTAGDFFYHLSHQGSPRIWERVAYSFSRVSSQPRYQTQVSCMAGGFFTN